MPTNFISVVQDLEDLLCHHITTSTSTDFTEELVDILKNVLHNDRTTHWSVQSFLHDLRDEYCLQRMPSLDTIPL
jgi:transcription elongation factor GreA-like protein